MGSLRGTAILIGKVGLGDNAVFWQNTQMQKTSRTHKCKHTRTLTNACALAHKLADIQIYLSRRWSNKNAPTFLLRPLHRRRHRRPRQRHQRSRVNEDCELGAENCALSKDLLFSCWKDPNQAGDSNLSRKWKFSYSKRFTMDASKLEDIQRPVALRQFSLHHRTSATLWATSAAKPLAKLSIS